MDGSARWAPRLRLATHLDRGLERSVDLNREPAPRLASTTYAEPAPADGIIHQGGHCAAVAEALVRLGACAKMGRADEKHAAPRSLEQVARDVHRRVQPVDVVGAQPPVGLAPIGAALPLVDLQASDGLVRCRVAPPCGRGTPRRPVRTGDHGTAKLRGRRGGRRLGLSLELGAGIAAWLTRRTLAVEPARAICTRTL